MRWFTRACSAVLLLPLACSGDPEPTPKPKDARILRFEATPGTIEVGQEVLLDWETTGTSGVNIEPRVGLQPATGNAKDKPLTTTTYTLSIPGGPAELTAQVTVTVSGGPPLVNEFQANPRTIAQGQAATLSWRTTNADQVLIEPGLGTQPAMGSVQVMPTVTTTYRLTAVRGAQTSPPQEVVVVVASGNQPMITQFTASPQTVGPGDPVTLSWACTNCTGATIDNGVGAQATSGSIVVRPMQTTVYTLTASGPGGNATASVTVSVTPLGPVTIKHFIATPMTVNAGGTVELSWDTDSATNVSIDNGIGSRPAKGTEIVTVNQTTTYNLTAFGATGDQATAQVTVTVAAPNAPVVLTFTAQPSAVLAGGTTTLSWTTQNATSVDIDNGVGNALSADGSVQVGPLATTTYTLTARGSGGQTATAMLTVTVNAAPPTIDSFTAQPASITAGQAATLSWMTTNATSVMIDNGVGAQAASGTAQVSPAMTTVYTLTAVGPGGMVTAQVSLSVTQPGAPAIDNFSAMPQQIQPGGQATLSWTVSNATSVSIDNGVGTQPSSGTRAVSPASTTTYTLTATGPGGTTTAQVTITVVSPVGDRCADAIAVSQSGTFTGNTQQAVNDYSQSNSCTGYASSGPDVVYRVALQAGDRLQASLNVAAPLWDSSLYLVTSCANIAQSCVAGQDNGNPEEIDYTVASAGDYYLIVDGFAGAGGPFTLTITISAAPIANDQCSGAIDVTQGGTFRGDTTRATGDYNLPIGSCTGYTSASRDVTYRVTLAAGERLQAALTATWDASLYLVSDCANVGPSCLAGQDNGNPEEVDYTAPGGGSFFLIVDGWGSAAGTFSLDVTISPPVTGGDVCSTAVSIPAGGGSFQSTTVGLMNDYDPPTTCTGYAAPGPDRAYALSLAAGDVVEVLAEFDSTIDGSVYAVTSCSPLSTCLAGADRALAGQPEELRLVAETSATHYLIVDAYGASTSGTHDLTVAHYTGETCATAAPLNVGDVAEFFTTMGRANDYSPNSGGCTGYTAAGPDRVYSVGVNAGDQLQVTVDPDGFDASLYVVSSCADVNGSCIQGSDVGVAANEELFPVFQTSGSYQVILDAYGASAMGRGTIQSRLNRGDTCGDAYYVPARAGTFTFAGTTAGYAADYGATTGTGSCTSYSQLGRDVVYRITLANNQRVSASLTTTWDGALYLVSNCASSATTCLAGQDNGNPEDLSYTNSSGSTQTYYLVVDSWRLSEGSTTREGNYSLSVTIQ